MNVPAVYGLIYMAEILLASGEGHYRPVALEQGDFGAAVVEAFLDLRVCFRSKNIVTLNVHFAVGARKGCRRSVIGYRCELGRGACCDRKRFAFVVFALHRGLYARGVFSLLEFVAIDGVVMILGIFANVLVAVFDKPDGRQELVCAVGPLYSCFGRAHNVYGVQKGR